MSDASTTDQDDGLPTVGPRLGGTAEVDPVPTGHCHAPLLPEKFVVRCPDCGHTERLHRRPGPNRQVCDICDRLMGVTPIAELDAATDGGQDVAGAEPYCPACGAVPESVDQSTASVTYACACGNKWTVAADGGAEMGGLERVDGYEVTAVVERGADTPVDVDYEVFAIEEADDPEEAEEIVLRKPGVTDIASHSETTPFRYDAARDERIYPADPEWEK